MSELKIRSHQFPTDERRLFAYFITADFGSWKLLATELIYRYIGLERINVMPSFYACLCTDALRTSLIIYRPVGTYTNEKSQRNGINLAWYVMPC